MASADYFARARREAAQRALGGQLLRKFGESLGRLLTRARHRSG
ncbi:hypothetical protein OG788_46840 [Streptomyces sp. NBC_00647]